jgi:hypothetical protein
MTVSVSEDEEKTMPKLSFVWYLFQRTPQLICVFRGGKGTSELLPSQSDLKPIIFNPPSLIKVSLNLVESG